MSNYEYHVVPFLGKIKGEKGNVSSQLEQTINQETNQGWEFVTLNSVNIEVKPGCLGSLLGKDVTYQRSDQLIFRREKT